MKIKSIHLNNFKSYKGLTKIQNLDGGLTANQNIILIGGLNGAGKTTFLEALFLCFYGKGANKLYPYRGAKNENYEAFSKSCLNDDVKATGVLRAQMYIEVHIDDIKIVGNFPKNVVLRRQWEFIRRGEELFYDKDTFIILEDGLPIQELPESECQDKIHQILPYGVAQFFFFDGEKIQDFAADANTEFANSLKDVLGITLYSQLLDDLKTIRSRILTEFNKDKTINEILLSRLAEKAKLEASIESNALKITNLQDEIDMLRQEKVKLDAETFRLTRITAENRDAYQVEKEQKEVEKTMLEKDYFDTAKDYLPFILANGLCKELETQLIQEKKYLDSKTAQNALEPQIQHLTNDILYGAPVCTPELKTDQIKFFQWKIDVILRKFFSPNQDNEVQDIEIIHQFSVRDSEKIHDMLQNYNRNIVDILQKKAEKLKQIGIDLQRLAQLATRSGGNDEAIKKLFDDKDNISHQIGVKDQQIEQAQHDILESKRHISELDKQITNLENKVQLHEKHKQQIAYCEKLQNTIKDFELQFKAKRTHELAAAILEMWNLLSQKDGHIKDIQILPESNFEVKIYGHNGQEKDKTKLSAGEKEIYAISLLWALVQVSGKQIPIVIDTPYGRLDSKHRANLAKYYFPRASHQVLLLSQDEEIVEEYYEILKPAIASEYSITYNPETRTSEIATGYKFAK